MSVLNLLLLWHDFWLVIILSRACEFLGSWKKGSHEIDLRGERLRAFASHPKQYLDQNAARMLIVVILFDSALGYYTFGDTESIPSTQNRSAEQWWSVWLERLMWRLINLATPTDLSFLNIAFMLAPAMVHIIYKKPSLTSILWCPSISVEKSDQDEVVHGCHPTLAFGICCIKPYVMVDGLEWTWLTTD